MLIQEPKDFNDLIKKLRDATFIVFDTETTGLYPYSFDQVIGMSFLIPKSPNSKTGDSYYIPFRHKDGKNIPIELLYWLSPIFSDPTKMLIGFNVKFDVNFIESENIQVNNVLLDTLSAAHLTNENELSFRLKSLSTKYLGDKSAISEQELMKKLKDRGLKKDGMQYLIPEEVFQYAEDDVILTWKLLQFYVPHLKNQKLHDLFLENSIYLKSAQEMEKNGLKVDPVKIHKYLEEAQKTVDKLYQKMKSIIGKDFNPSSVPQLREILKQKETDKAALKKSNSPVAKLLLEYRQWLKAINTYYKPFLEMRDANNRIHPNLSLVGTITGRFSCNTPNLQALPKGSNIYKVRDTVIASKGYTLASFDYNQAELRLLAHYSKDPFLVDVFTNNKDLHGETAKLLGIDRNRAKRINFGIVYGIGATSLSENLECSVEQAQQYLTEYHSKIVSVVKFYRYIDNLAKKQGFIRLWTGRRRHYRKGENETHKAMSNIIQGGVAEVMRTAICKVFKATRGSRVKLLLQVHDEILLEIPTHQLDEWVTKIKSLMEDFEFSVPIKVEVKVGETWGGTNEWRQTKLFVD